MKKHLSVAYVILAGIFWGSSCLFVQKMSDMGFSPLQSTAVRMTAAAIILNIALLIKDPRSYKMSVKSYALCVFSGICSVLAMCVCYYYSMAHTSAAVSAILLYTAPIFVMIMSVIFFKEKITAKKCVAFLIAITGCALVSGAASGVSVSGIGILFGVLSGFAYSLYGIITVLFMKENSEPIAFSALSFAFGAVGAIAISRPWEIISATIESENPLITVIFFFTFGVCTAAVPYAFYTVGLSGIRPDVASILAYSEPLTAAVLGIVVLRQPFDIFQGAGIVLVVTAIALINFSPQKQI